MSDESKAEGSQTNPVTEPGSTLVTRHSSLVTHSIRLGPPWQVTATDAGARHARKFGRPRALDADERLWLVCRHVPAAAEVLVNGAAVGTPAAAGPFAADVTSLLRP